MQKRLHIGQMFLKRFKGKHPVAFWVAALFSGTAVFLSAAYLYIAHFMPLPDLYLEPSNLPASKIFDRNGILLYEVLKPESGKKTLIPLEKIPQKFVQATLAAEDINFYSHPGVDAGAIARAIFYNIQEQRVVSGGSTITQQLIRNMAGSNAQRGLADKLAEAAYAIRISNVYGKDRILELYLNTIYYGNLSYGAQSAAQDYFGKNIYDLDLAQCALLAGLPQSPSRYNPFGHFDLAKKRQKYVLEQMVKYGFISREQAEAAQAEPLILRPNKYRMKAPHFVQQVMDEIEDKYGAEKLINGGLTITATLDYNLQLKAEAILKKQVELLARNNVTNGALLALDTKTAQVLAWVGSADYFDEAIAGSVDMVTALRQPGSSIKPLNYLLAFEKGYTPATVIYDIPTQFDTDTGPYSPKNYDLEYHGPVRVRSALASSFNIPAVKTLEYAGIENFIGFLRKLGIDTLDKPPNFYGLALTLGGGEVTVMDMADAFNVIANYGVSRPSSILLHIEDSNGAVLYDWKQPEGEYVLGPYGRQHSYQIIDIISDPLARIPGFGEGSVLELSRPAAVKTGTTRNFRDNWTIGFTPELLTAVWVGNADSSPMENVSGVDGAAPVWAGFMESALSGRPKSSFDVPAGLVETEICALSGKLPTDFCRERTYEIFVAGTEPREKDDWHKPFYLDRKNGHVIPPGCINRYPASDVSHKVLIDYPAELEKWAIQEGLQLPPIDYCSGSSGYSEGYTDGYSNVQAAGGFSWDGAVGGASSGTVTNGSGPGTHDTGTAEPQLFSIDNPLNNDEYLLQSTLPLKDQRIPVRVTVPPNTVKVIYRVDGDAAAGETEVTQAPFTYLWTPVRGTHTLEARAVLTDGSELSRRVVFIVK